MHKEVIATNKYTINPITFLRLEVYCDINSVDRQHEHISNEIFIDNEIGP